MIADSALEAAAGLIEQLIERLVKRDDMLAVNYRLDASLRWDASVRTARAAIVAYLRERARQAAPFSDGALVCSKVADELAEDGQ